MKVLFLDIDGVCNCVNTREVSGGFVGIDPMMAFIVGKIQLDTGCEVVLSSAWRHMPDGVKEVEEKIVKLFDKTGESESGIRGEEIKTWLDAHPEVTRYAILDDDSDMLVEQLPNFFKTTWQRGITKEIAEEVTKHLNEEVQSS